MYTYIKPTLEGSEVFFVETWWDRFHYITQIKNANLEQVGDAWFSVTRADAKKTHIVACSYVTKDIPYIEEHIIKP